MVSLQSAGENVAAAGGEDNDDDEAEILKKNRRASRRRLKLVGSLVPRLQPDHRKHPGLNTDSVDYLDRVNFGLCERL